MKSYFEDPGTLKIDLMLRGIRLDDSAALALPEGEDSIDIVLPGNIPANVPCGLEFTLDSPYALKSQGQGLSSSKGPSFVVADGKDSLPVALLPRPSFYSSKTSSGVPLRDIAKAHGSFVVITPHTRCDFFGEGVECRYCAGNFDVANAGGLAKTYSVDDVLETVEAVKKEKGPEVIYLSIGFSRSDDGGMGLLAPYINAVKKHFNALVAVEALPPADNRWIDETYALGADSVLYNLEIYDKELFEIICPGRARLIGRDRYLDALRHAASVFPSGTVGTHLIVGLEPPGSTCAGIDFLSGMGVVPILPIYRPSKGRALRIEPLTAEVIIPVYRHLYRALKRENINMNWMRDISVITTPVEMERPSGERRSIAQGIMDVFYRSRFALKAAWGLSTIRRKLRVRRAGGHPSDDTGEG